MVAAEAFATGRAAAPRRAAAGRRASSATGPTRCADGYVTLGALEPKFWQAFCHGVGREDLVDHAFDPPGSPAHARGERDLRRAHARAVARVRLRARLLPRAGARARRGARLRAGARRGRWSWRSTQPGAERPVKLLGTPIKLSRTPADPARAPGPALGEHTDEVLAAAGFTAAGDRGAARIGRGRRRRGDGPGLASWRHDGGHRRHAEDVRARRALGRQRRDDQALPARGAARHRGRGRCAPAATWPTTRPSSSSGSS